MKHLFTLTICACFLFACRKANHLQADDYLSWVQTALKDSVSSQDLNSLDFSSSVLSSVDSVDLHFLRIPFKNHSVNQFVLLQTTKEGRILQGRFTEINGEVVDEAGIKKFQGHITIQTLQRRLLVGSPIKDGFITTFHNNTQTRSSLVQPGSVMPEVIVTYVIPSSGAIFWSTWFSLQSLFGSYDQPYYSFFNNDAGGGGSWSGGGSTGYPYPTGGGGTPIGGSGGPVNEPPILVDFESQDEAAELDLQKVITCFNAIPNAGARSSIEILTDIPVDVNPNAMYDLGEKAPGHVFLKLSKTNGAQQVERYIGFYPKSGYKSTTYAPTASKLVSNEFHEYNASLSMNIAPERLATVLSAIQLYSARNYDVDEYNCTNFALDVFNSIRGIGLSIPLYGIPGSPLTQTTATPGGLYNKLKQMWDSNDPEKANIVMGAFKGWAGPNWGCQ